MKIGFWGVIFGIAIGTFSSVELEARSKRRTRSAPEPNIPAAQQIPYCKSELEKRLQKLTIQGQQRFSVIEVDEKPIKIEESEFSRFARKKSKTVYGQTMTLKARGLEVKGVRHINVRCGYAQNHLMSLTYELMNLEERVAEQKDLSTKTPATTPKAIPTTTSAQTPITTPAKSDSSDSAEATRELREQEATMEQELPQDTNAPTVDEAPEEEKLDEDAHKKANE